MISLRKLERLALARSFGPLRDAVLDNGRRLPVAARAMLSDASAAPLVAAALALQRTVELTYQPVLLSELIARHLIAATDEWLAHQAGPRGRPAPGDAARGPVAAHPRPDDEPASGDDDRLAFAGLALAAMDDLTRQARESGAALPDDVASGLQRLTPHLLHVVLERAASLDAATLTLTQAMAAATLLWQCAGRPTLALEVAHVADTLRLRRALARSRWRHDAAVAHLLALADAPPRPVGVLGPATGGAFAASSAAA